MQIQITLDLDDKEMALISSVSIERVMNNAINIGAVGSKVFKLEAYKTDASTLWQDCEELKPITRKLWGAVQNQIFRARAA